MKMLVAYDIADPRRLYRVAKVMKDYGLRLQLSVFEVEMTPVRFKEMRHRIEAQLEWSEDGVKFFPLCKQCDESWLAIGMNVNHCETRPFAIL